MTEPNCAEFDELHRTWLERPDIEICELICLAHGSPPGTFGRITDPDAQPHFRALKALIKRKLLPHYSDGSQADRFTVITLEDLLRCLELDEIASDPYYNWLRKFAERWRQYCALPAIKRDGTTKAETRPQYSIAQVRQSYIGWLSSLGDHPTMTQSDEWLSHNFNGFKRQTFRDEISRPLMPEECLRPGPRSTKKEIDLD